MENIQFKSVETAPPVALTRFLGPGWSPDQPGRHRLFRRAPHQVVQPAEPRLHARHRGEAHGRTSVGRGTRSHTHTHTCQGCYVPVGKAAFVFRLSGRCDVRSWRGQPVVSPAAPFFFLYRSHTVLSSLPVCRHGGPLASDVFDDDDEGAPEDQGGRLEEGEGLYARSSQWEAEQEAAMANRASPVAAITEKVLLASWLSSSSHFDPPSYFTACPVSRSTRRPAR